MAGGNKTPACDCTEGKGRTISLDDGLSYLLHTSALPLEAADEDTSLLGGTDFENPVFRFTVLKSD